MANFLRSSVVFKMLLFLLLHIVFNRIKFEVIAVLEQIIIACKVRSGLLHLFCSVAKVITSFTSKAALSPESKCDYLHTLWISTCWLNFFGNFFWTRMQIRECFTSAFSDVIRAVRAVTIVGTTLSQVNLLITFKFVLRFCQD